MGWPAAVSSVAVAATALAEPVRATDRVSAKGEG